MENIIINAIVFVRVISFHSKSIKNDGDRLVPVKNYWFSNYISLVNLLIL